MNSLLMGNRNQDLQGFALNVYSQNGEDGIILEILDRIDAETSLSKWCVELGAWDGIHLSNTCRLIRERGYKAVLIEGDRARAEQIGKNFSNDQVESICCFIGLEGPNKLDYVLADTNIPRDFDFLSIDIDGADYHIFESLTLYLPKIICIEFNTTIPNSVDYAQPKDLSIKHGSSAKAITSLANDKGYSLVSVVGCNLIFVRNNLANFVLDSESKLEDLFPEGNDPQYIFIGHDGTILSNRDYLVFGCHGFRVPLEKVQFLPKRLRVYIGDYTLFWRMILGIFLLRHFPRKVLHNFKSKFR